MTTTHDDRLQLWNFHANQTEGNVLCSILFHEETKKWASVNPPDPSLFRNEDNQKFAHAYRSMSEISNEPNGKLLLDMLAGMNMKERKKWQSFITDLSSNFTPQNVDSTLHFIERLRTIDFLKSHYYVAKTVMNKIMNLDFIKLEKEEKEVLNYLEGAFYEIEKNQRQEIKEMRLSEGIPLAVKNAEEEANGKPSSFISLGYKAINKLLSGGIPKKGVGIIGGRPGMGKTALMINSSYETSLEGTKTLFISIEMTLLQLFQRLLCRIANIDMKLLLQPSSLSKQDWQNLKDAIEEVNSLGNQDIFFYETSKLSPAMLERTVKHYKKKYGVELIYVDYVQIMCLNNGRPAVKAEDIQFISNEISRIAKEQDVAIVLGSQLNRDSESRGNSRPQQSDIKGSGALEQDAVFIIGLYRDEVYNKETTEKPNILECIVVKARFGEIGTAELFTNLRRQLITELPEAKNSPPPEQAAA